MRLSLRHPLSYEYYCNPI
ncbi:hypothetical protein IEO21_10326 [Rhodonia placenta]|uniref:Uncharacterized protein n=1 Tax=Rhodonia placenta TaxID=104341 RepID=A0A8H7TXE9_9APHY|nr:hypothetical protein IEO21_10326 [Postia placenta]